jgi:mono/diheme cytochrome c family protein
MRKRIELGAAALTVMLTAAGCERLSPVAETVQADTTQSAKVERGRYLVTVGGCNDCHTPWIVTERGPEPDLTRMLSGHPESVPMPLPPRIGQGPWQWVAGETNTAFAGPWGVSFAFNLTPDENTGIGIWTEEMFVRTIRSGRHWGVSRPIQPPMPWFNYAKLTDEDLKAVYAFLRTIPPVHNRVPEYIEPHELDRMAGGLPQH